MLRGVASCHSVRRYTSLFRVGVEMKVFASRREKAALAVLLVLALVWFERAHIKDFFSGVLEGVEMNKGAHDPRSG